MRSLGALILVAGCGFTSVNTDADAGSDLSVPVANDLAGIDLAGLDLASADLGQANIDMAGGCAGPTLLVAVQSVNGAASNDGRVLQIALTSDGAMPCGRELTGGKTLPKFPTAVAWIAPDIVAYGAQEGVYFLDAAKDSYRWSFKTPMNDIPRAIFSLERNGSTVVGVGYDTDGYNDVRALYIFDLSMNKKLHEWDLTDSVNSPIYLGSSVPAMAQSPLDATRIFYVNNGTANDPAAEIAVPYDGTKVNPTVYWDSRPPGPYFRTIQTARSPSGLRRTVWLQTGGLSSDADGVYQLIDSGSGPQMTGPLRCTTLAECKQPFKASDAVPDPTAANRVISTCNSPTSNVKHVVRFDDAGTCTLLVDGTRLPTLTYPEKLAIAEAR